MIAARAYLAAMAVLALAGCAAPDAPAAGWVLYPPAPGEGGRS